MTPIHSRPRAQILRRRHLAAGLALALAAPLASAVTVTSCADSGAGSLRDAIGNAASGDTIDFTGLACNAITLDSGELAVTIDNLKIRGPGSTALSISGGDASRIFNHTGNGTLDLSGLSLVHGHNSGDGGCVYSAANVSLDDIVATACVAGDSAVSGGRGGALAVEGNATITGGSFNNNSVDGRDRVRGGAIFVGSTLDVTGSTFSDNTAWSHSGGNYFGTVAEGGAIFALVGASITDTTISGNTAKADTYEVFGGGVASGSHPDHAVGSLTLLRSHVTGNTATTQCGVCAPQGGGIAAVGATTISDSTIANNTVYSPNHYGGAGGLRVFQASEATVTGSVVANNSAPSAGGGLFGPENGVLTVDKTLVTGNHAGNEAGLDEGGGGILCLGCAVVLTNSTVSGNTAGANGGGIRVYHGEYAAVPTQVTNSTISGNSTDKEGGAIMMHGGDAQFSNSTIAFNTAKSRGAGISVGQYSYSINLRSTIVANNTTNGTETDIWSSSDVNGSHNLIMQTGGSTGAPADTISDDPLLQPLDDNGGAMPTLALGEGSPAIDAGSNPLNLEFDQRGDGFVREYGDAADIGAYEVQPPPVDNDTIFVDGFEG